MPDEPIYVFDACAVLAFVHHESGAETAAGLLEGSRNRCLLHAVNACEVYYDLYRRGGETTAASLDEVLASTGLVLDASLTPEFWQAAGKIKAEWRRVSIADCFALALAMREEGTLVTTDHHEFDALGPAELCPILFIR